MTQETEGAPEGVTEDTAAADLVAEETTQEQPGADAAAEATEGEAEQPKPKKTAQDRIDELTRDKHAERRAREAAERELERLRAAAQPKPEPPKEEGPPDPTDYTYGETDPGFIRDLATYTADKRFEERMREHTQRETRQSEAKTWEQRQAAFAKAKPDYYEVFNRDWDCPPPMADAIRDSEDGPALAYHLAQNPDEARRIAALPPRSQIREIGRLEGRIATAAAPVIQPKTVSDAPAPHPQARGAGGQFKPAPDTNDFAAFEKLADGVLQKGR